MSFGADCLINKLNTNITGLGADNQTSLDFGQIGGALNSLENAMCCVATINDLPAACDNIGRFIYITACKSFRYSDGFQWVANRCSDINFNRILWTWGSNGGGALGDGTTTNRCSPGTTAGGCTTWCQVAAGAVHTAAIKTDGTLWTWGNNNQGRLGDGTTTARCSPGTIAGGGTNWCQVGGGSAHTAAIKTDGTLWTWGSNYKGLLGNGTITDRCSPGTVAGGGTTWCQVSSSKRFTAAIKTDGTLWTWGSNGYNDAGYAGNAYGFLGNGNRVDRCSPGTVAGGGTNWCQVSSSERFAAAIKTDGTLWTWGGNYFGQLGDGTRTQRCSPGTVAGCGTNWCQVAGGIFHNTAIKTDGTLWTWGNNTSGILGNGTATNRCSPGTVAGGGTTWCQVGGGCYHNTAIKTDGTLWTWGNNTLGKLGDGTTVSRCSPGTTVGGGTNWCQVSGGSIHTAVIRVKGF